MHLFMRMTCVRTLFQNADAWPMPDSADPLEGWANPDVFATFNGPASKDLYGKLYYYVKGVLRSFCQRMSSLECNIQMFSIDAQERASHLQVSSFARIDVSCSQAFTTVTRIWVQFSILMLSQGFKYCRRCISWAESSYHEISAPLTESS